MCSLQARFAGDMKVQNLESYLFKVDWDVVAFLKIQARHMEPNKQHIFPSLFDVELNDKDVFSSGELTYGSIGEISPSPSPTSTSKNLSCPGPTINFEFFIERVTPKMTCLYAKLKSKKFEFQIGSATVCFNDYSREFFGFSLHGEEELVENGQAKPLPMNGIISQPFSGIGHTNSNASALFSTNYSDVTISCGLKEYPAHKVIICNKSKVLEAAFAQSMIEGRTGKMSMEDTEPEIVEEFLRFLYTGAVANLAENASTLLIIADKYDLQDLKALCEKVILNSTVTDGNELKLYELGNLGNSEPIIHQSVKRIRKNKNSIWKSEEEFSKSFKSHPELIHKVLGLRFPNSNEENGGNGVGSPSGKKQRTE